MPESLTLPPAKEFIAAPGRGIRAEVAGKLIRVGNQAYMEESSVDLGEYAARAAVVPRRRQDRPIRSRGWNFGG